MAVKLTGQKFTTIDANGNRLINIADGTGSTDAVNFSQLDGRLETVSSLTGISNPTTGDNVYLDTTEGDNQPGIYRYSGTAWVIVVGGAGVPFGNSLPLATDGTIGELFRLLADDSGYALGFYVRISNDGFIRDWRQLGEETGNGTLPTTNLYDGRVFYLEAHDTSGTNNDTPGWYVYRAARVASGTVGTDYDSAITADWYQSGESIEAVNIYPPLGATIEASVHVEPFEVTAGIWTFGGTVYIYNGFEHDIDNTQDLWDNAPLQPGTGTGGVDPVYRSGWQTWDNFVASKQNTITQYAPSTSYSVGDLVWSAGEIFRNIQALVSPHTQEVPQNEPTFWASVTTHVETIDTFQALRDLNKTGEPQANISVGELFAVFDDGDNNGLYRVTSTGTAGTEVLRIASVGGGSGIDVEPTFPTSPSLGQQIFLNPANNALTENDNHGNRRPRGLYAYIQPSSDPATRFWEQLTIPEIGELYNNARVGDVIYLSAAEEDFNTQGNDFAVGFYRASATASGGVNVTTWVSSEGNISGDLEGLTDVVIDATPEDGDVLQRYRTSTGHEWRSTHPLNVLRDDVNGLLAAGGGGTTITFPVQDYPGLPVLQNEALFSDENGNKSLTLGSGLAPVVRTDLGQMTLAYTGLNETQIQLLENLAGLDLVFRHPTDGAVSSANIEDANSFHFRVVDYHYQDATTRLLDFFFRDISQQTAFLAKFGWTQHFVNSVATTRWYIPTAISGSEVRVTNLIAQIAEADHLHVPGGSSVLGSSSSVVGADPLATINIGGKEWDVLSPTERNLVEGATGEYTYQTPSGNEVVVVDNLDGGGSLAVNSWYWREVYNDGSSFSPSTWDELAPPTTGIPNEYHVLMALPSGAEAADMAAIITAVGAGVDGSGNDITDLTEFDNVTPGTLYVSDGTANNAATLKVYTFTDSQSNRFIVDSVEEFIGVPPTSGAITISAEGADMTNFSGADIINEGSVNAMAYIAMQFTASQPTDITSTITSPVANTLYLEYTALYNRHLVHLVDVINTTTGATITYRAYNRRLKTGTVVPQR